MIDQRRVRFASLGPFVREDLPLVAEVWRDDIVHAPWASRETMKLGAVLAAYIINREPHTVGIRALENNHNLLREEVRRSLAMMTIFGFVEGFNVEGDDVRVALRLTAMQTVRILDMKQKLASAMPAIGEQRDLQGEAARGGSPACDGTGGGAGRTQSAGRAGGSEPVWLPPAAEVPVTAEVADPPVVVRAGHVSEVLFSDVWMLQRMADALRAERSDRAHGRGSSGSAR
ncbi:MAG: hypothetical protein KDJ37_13060 [Hyphomicrobiaceae bacterium]|nr:hypothetical protein [Hyphomicrobiaceae bacterium]